VILVRLVLSNAPIPMLVTFVPIVTLVKLAQYANVESPMLVMPVANHGVGHAATINTPHPMLVTLSGIVILVRPVSENAPLPMLVTLLGSVTLLKLVPTNASSRCW